MVGDEAGGGRRDGAAEPRVRRGMAPSAELQKGAAEEIAEDPAKLQLAGRLMSRAGTGSDVRFGKVAALRQQIEAGAYSVSAEELAEKLMDDLRR